MKEIKAILQPFVLDAVCDALSQIKGLPGLTISHVEGFGIAAPVNAGEGTRDEGWALAPKRKLEVVVTDALVPVVVAAITRAAQTGKPGDGKIFVLDVVDAVKIRTGERGEGGI
jgi:nitrogen regulatory protein PII